MKLFCSDIIRHPIVYRRSPVATAVVAAILACAVSCGTSKENWDPKLDGIQNERLDFRSEDPIAKTAGMGLLREQNLPDGHKEIRFWMYYGGGWPQEMFRFIMTPDTVYAHQILHWGGGGANFEDSLSDDRIARGLGRSCTDHRRSPEKRTCRTLYREEPDWVSIYEEMVDLGLWWLPDESALPEPTSFSTGGRSAMVELRNGSRYRAYRHGNPNLHPWPESQRMSRILDLLQATHRLEVEREEID